MNSTAISFWNFLSEHSVEIPIIQRDYAQGRKGKESLRRGFLTDLKNALDSKEEMKLDFVYGAEKDGKLNPLDGQQRLTTLWLLHWYVALRAKKLREASDILKKFTYETRISSREFFEELCKTANFDEKFDKIGGSNVVGFITKQTWFYSAWNQDPTIQSMLRMLGGTKGQNKHGANFVNGIEDLFAGTADFQNYWESLTGSNCPIVFYNLPLKDFGLSDDLYIKMNARGKQLTSFENFKADLIGYIEKQSKDESLSKNEREEWENLLDAADGIPIKLDTSWTGIFWKNKSIGIKDKDGKVSKEKQIDEIYFAFFNRFFWNELFVAKKSESGEYILDIGKGEENSTQENNNPSYKYLNSDDGTIAYKDFSFYRYHEGKIPLSFFQKLTNVLDRYLKYSEDNSLPECLWNPDFSFIAKYEADDKGNNIEITNTADDTILKITELTQIYRIVFFAICKYFDHGDESTDEEASLKRWLRVVWNLVSGKDADGRPQIRSTQAVRTAIEFIEKMDSHNIYFSLANYEEKLSDSEFDKQCKEEIVKARQILNEEKRPDGKTWEELIIEAERFAFFEGSIRFLFRDGKGKLTDWENFDTKWENVQNYFDKNGVKDSYKVELTKKLVIQCDDWKEQLYDKQVFNPNGSTWKWILCSKNWSAPVNSILTKNLEDIACTSTNTDKNVAKYITPLLNDLPYEWMIKKIPTGRFRWIDNRIAYYKPYGREFMLFDWENFKRNEILIKLIEEKVIETDKRIQDSNFFKDWNINFKYNNHFFQWWGSPNNKELDVYLMEDEWNDYKKRLNPTSGKGTDEDEYYCFRVTGNDVDDFKRQLDTLINAANSKKI